METEILNAGKYKILSNSTIKIIAIITMLIDHFALIIMPYIPGTLSVLFSLGGKEISIYFIARKIGRLAFPLFCFMITEGFIHTGNRKKYGLNLLVFALISEIPFNLIYTNKIFCPEHQNVFFGLFSGFLCLYIINSVSKKALQFLMLLAVLAIVSLSHIDYGLHGVLLIILIYALKNQPVIRALLALPLLSGGLAAWCAFLPISLYNGERGFIKAKWLKYSFYAFYPVHILILVLIRYLLFLK